MLKTCVLLMMATATTAACGGASDGGGELVGRWELRDEDSGELEAMYAFEEDGTYAFREYGEAAESHRGTYEADGELLLLEGIDDGGHDLVGEVSYFAGGDRFILGALRPDGEVDGPVGRWTGSLRVEVDGEVDVDVENAYQLAAGGGATIESRSGSRRETIDDASWTQQDGEIVVSFESSGVTVNLHMVLVDGEALGSPVFQRTSG
ncbi:MAG TPA: hypothetical protein VFU21_21785 [Kofleriaceae bacterium]|nr:hypothetical protein [Kofleriaceae bacterium]